MIAITGGIGSGKSTATEILSQYGDVVSCDKINAELLSDPSYLASLNKLFPQCFGNDGFDRRKMAQLIFSDEEARKRLNGISHPMILKKLSEKLKDCKKEVVFIEVPLLKGTAFESCFSEIIVVTASKEKKLERIEKRDNVDRDLAEKKIASQESDLTFKNATVYYIDNSGTMDDLIKDCAQLVKKIMNK